MLDSSLASPSPSSRRAWIEIIVAAVLTCLYVVALLAEGVDRNNISTSYPQKYQHVALLAEGVDRNLTLVAEGTVSIGRPPRGGRG